MSTGRQTWTHWLVALLAALAVLPADGPQPQAADAESQKKTQVPKALRPVLSRAEVLANDPVVLERIGRHLVIGYHSFATAKALVEKRAIAGIFITDHNVSKRKIAEVRAEIDALQGIRAKQGLPPLVIAADQEGGAVSRLSPPLARQTGLSRVIAGRKPGDDLQSLVTAYAQKQAGELKRIGVNLNFSPVVDLKIDPHRRSDGETQLRYRALSSDAATVSDVAGWYCDALQVEGIYCTIKHFPGLGRVTLDTHRRAGEIKATAAELNATDWVPFRRLMGRPNVVTMLAHVRLTAIDPGEPASLNQRIIDGLIRKEWKYDGLLITDDLSMGAVTRSKDGVGQAAVKALNAGADLLLVSFSDRYLDAIMTALIEADLNGGLDAKARTASLERLKKLPSAHPPLQKPRTAQSEAPPAAKGEVAAP
ncbi:MAG: glycoside hydrolase family 3 protein [Hyphomicrobium sp.]|jgi:beta-N-acetylhexosaminidase|nr:glycoside hydrolase family 3 protein [Hyphomicrobium sp.]